MTRLWSKAQLSLSSETTMVESCGLSLAADRLFAVRIQNTTHAYPTSNQQPKPEVGT